MPEVKTHDFIITFAAVIGITLGLFVFDTALAELDARETRSQAVQEFSAGQWEIGKGNLAKGIEHLRKATALDRKNVDYTIALPTLCSAPGNPGKPKTCSLPFWTVRRTVERRISRWRAYQSLSESTWMRSPTITGPFLDSGLRDRLSIVSARASS